MVVTVVAVVAVMVVAANTSKTDFVAFLAGLTFFCASLELLIPKPLPFFRLGLANAVVMLALQVLTFKNFLLLLLLKVFGQALVSGTLFSYIFLFSVGGTFVSGLGMYMLNKVFGRHISFVGLSCFGAFLSSVTHLGLAYSLVFGTGVLLFAAPVLLTGFVTSLILAFFLSAFTEKSQWYKDLFDKNGTDIHIVHHTDKVQTASSTEFIIKILVALCLFVILFYFNTLLVKAIVCGFVIILCFLSKVKINLKTTLFFFISLLIVNICIPNGKILYTLFGFKITLGAILLGIERFLYFQIFVLLSKWLIKTHVSISGVFGEYLAKSFYVFEYLLEHKPQFKKNDKGIIHIIDTYFSSVYNAIQ